MAEQMFREKDQKKTSTKSITILVLISILFAVFLVEVIARLMPQLIPPVFTKFFFEQDLELAGLIGDGVLGYKYAPDLVEFPVHIVGDSGEVSTYPLTTTSLGYEGIGFRDDGIDGEPYAVVVGDSFASCFGVLAQDCWVEILEKNSGRDFANLGVSGYGPQQAEQMLTRYGMPLKPSLILWVFFANDPYDAWHFEQFGHSEVREGEFWNIPFSRWLIQQSVTAKMLAFFWFYRYFIYDLVFRNEDALTLDSNLFWWTTTNPANPHGVEGLRLTQQAVLRARGQSKGLPKETEFVLVIIPTREQIYYEDTRLQFQLDTLNEELVNFARRNDIPIVDLTPAIRDAVPNEPFLYNRRDFHLNSRGNEFVAQILQERLKEILKGHCHSAC